MDAGAGRIDIQGLTKAYAGRTVLHGITLTVEPGQFVALIGASGSGKTTLLKSINRLAEPDSGTVCIDGEPVTAMGISALRRRIGYVFQGIGLFPHMTVAENIAVGPSLLGWPKAEIEARVAELLALVDLPSESASRRPRALSGGQQQRVGVARALAARPGLMLMDEPFGALDPVTRDTLGQAYRALHDRLGLTTLMVTHDVQEALLLADRVLVLGQGRILADAPPKGLVRGHGDPGVDALIATPRRQAERLSALMDGAARDKPA